MTCINCRQQPSASPSGRCLACQAWHARTLGRTGPPPQYRELRGPAKAAIAFLGCALVIEVFAMIASVNMASITDTLLHHPLGVTYEHIHAANRLNTLAGQLRQGAVAATAVPFLLWFRRARLNAEHFDPDAMRSTRGWAIGAWFVPIGFLWLPKRVANDIRSATVSSASTHNAVAVGPSRQLLNIWWALWLSTVCGPAAGTFVGDIVYATFTGADTDNTVLLGLAHERALVNAGAAMAGILAAGAAALVIRQITTAHRALAEAFPADSRVARGDLTRSVKANGSAP